jgi:hypothetical protein
MVTTLRTKLLKIFKTGERVIILKWLNRIQKQVRCELDGTKV